MKKTIFFCLLFISIAFAVTNISAQWQPEVRMTNDPAMSYTSFGNARCIAANGDIIHAVWYSGDTVGRGRWDIFYKRSTDKGVTWGAAVNLSNSDSCRYNPAIAVSGSYIHVVWYDRRDGNSEEYYRRSTDGGITWDPVTRLTNKPAGSAHCSIAASGLNVHIVWYDYRVGLYGFAEIYYKRSVDGGTTWSEDLRLSNTAGQSWMPAVAVSGSVVHVAWYDSTAGNWEIYYKRSLDGGLNWGADTRLTNNSAISNYPTLAVSGSTVHLAWVDYRNGTGNIYYKRSANGGTSWGSDTRLTKSNYANYHPSLAVNGSVLHLVFYRLVPSRYDLMYNVSNNDGVKWGNDVQLTNNPSYSSVPSVAVSGSSVHILFRDNRDGNYEIYYKRFKSSAAGPEGFTNNDPETPKTYSMSQNYPNPFNPVTKISFNVPKQAFVSLKVFDALGREVSNLVDAVKEPGSYSVDFNGAELTSGVYFYRLQSAEFTDIKRMTLIK
ncbi:MAG: exo-alpha-sialidase [Ignavibacteriae bacterium]|nr:exo-alpha-sialidase [Ignavibacteriota bacterium]